MKVGVQLYNFAKTTDLDFQEKIHVAKTLGYDCVELHGYAGGKIGAYTARQVKEILDRHQVQAMGSHVGLQLMLTEMDAVAAFHREIGVRMVGIPRPVVNTGEDMDVLLCQVQAVQRQLRDNGLALYYHCHDFEFMPIEGRYLVDELIEKTDVPIELDYCWAYKSGEDELALAKKYQHRIRYVHIKDWDGRQSCSVGSGMLPCEEYYRLSKALGFEYIIVEDDSQLPDGITSVANSMQAIRKFM